MLRKKKTQVLRITITRIIPSKSQFGFTSKREQTRRSSSKSLKRPLVLIASLLVNLKRFKSR